MIRNTSNRVLVKCIRVIRLINRVVQSRVRSSRTSPRGQRPMRGHHHKVFVLLITDFIVRNILIEALLDSRVLRKVPSRRCIYKVSCLLPSSRSTARINLNALSALRAFSHRECSSMIINALCWQVLHRFRVPLLVEIHWLLLLVYDFIGYSRVIIIVYTTLITLLSHDIPCLMRPIFIVVTL